MDKGLNIREIEGLFDTAGDYVDIVKLGWGTSYVTNNLEKKIALYRSFETPVVCGGTLFEAVYARDKIDEFKRWLEHSLLARRDLGRHARDPARAQARADRRLRPRLHRPLRGRLEGLRGRLRALPVGPVDQGGARGRRLEGDHRGARGRHRRHLPQGRRHAHRPDRRDRARDRLPRPDLRGADEGSQAWFVKHFGPEVNLGNIAPDEVIPLETLRLGLRGDTLRRSCSPTSPRRRPDGGGGVELGRGSRRRLARSHLAERAPAERLVEASATSVGSTRR